MPTVIITTCTPLPPRFFRPSYGHLCGVWRSGSISVESPSVSQIMARHQSLGQPRILILQSPIDIYNSVGVTQCGKINSHVEMVFFGNQVFSYLKAQKSEYRPNK